MLLAEAAITFLFILIAFDVVTQETIALDTILSGLAYAMRSPGLTLAMEIVSFFGSTPFIASATLIFFIALLVKKLKKEAWLFGITMLASVGLNNALKYLIHRTRPDMNPLEQAAFYSFPSGHAMNSLVFYGLIACLIYRATRSKTQRAIAVIAGVFLVALIGFSRVYLGAHYPTDVIAGFLAGSSILIGAIAINPTTVVDLSESHHR